MKSLLIFFLTYTMATVTDSVPTPNPTDSFESYTTEEHLSGVYYEPIIPLGYFFPVIWAGGDLGQTVRIVMLGDGNEVELVTTKNDGFTVIIMDGHYQQNQEYFLRVYQGSYNYADGPKFYVALRELPNFGISYPHSVQPGSSFEVKWNPAGTDCKKVHLTMYYTETDLLTVVHTDLSVDNNGQRVIQLQAHETPSSEYMLALMGDVGRGNENDCTAEPYFGKVTVIEPTTIEFSLNSPAGIAIIAGVSVILILAITVIVCLYVKSRKPHVVAVTN